MLKNIKDLRKNIVGVEFNENKMFSIQNKQRASIDGFTVVSALVVTKKIKLAESLGLLDINGLSVVYSTYQSELKLAKLSGISSKRVMLAGIREKLLAKYNEDYQREFVETLCNEKKIQDFIIPLFTTYEMLMQPSEKSAVLKLRETKYAENGKKISSLIVATYDIGLGLDINQVDEQYKEIVKLLAFNFSVEKSNKGIKEAIVSLSDEIKELPSKIREDLIVFLKSQSLTEIDTEVDYVEIL